MRRIAVQERRATLLAAALQVIARDGIGRASTRAITAEAGMPTASFHYVFDSYDDMVEQLVASILATQTTAVAEAVVEAAGLREYVVGALLGWLDRAEADAEAELALLDIVAWSRSAPALRHLAVAVYEQYAAAIASFVEAAEARFGARWRIPSCDVARFVLVLTDGVAARWSVDRDIPAARRALAVGAQALMALTAEVVA